MEDNELIKYDGDLIKEVDIKNPNITAININIVGIIKTFSLVRKIKQ